MEKRPATGRAQKWPVTGEPFANPPPQEDKGSCFCFESDDDSAERIRIKYTKRRLARGCLSNMTICVILVSYTFVGAIMFLGIEGGSLFASLGLDGKKTERPVPATASVSPRLNGSWVERLGDEPRAQAVERIWDITWNLNILYKENWTRLAAQEITKFQESLVKRIQEEMSAREVGAGELRSSQHSQEVIEWTLARAFLYSLTILTTIGYGDLGPRTGLGKLMTMCYAGVGIPLVLLYLASVGTLLSSCARNVFTRSLCCCLCSNCGYCCYDEKRMEEKERRMRRKRERREYEERLRAGQEPFYVRSASAYTTSTTNDSIAPLDESKAPTRSASIMEPESLSNESLAEKKSSTDFLPPLLLCLVVILTYVGGGALVLYRLEESWSFFESVFFCFMVLSTIGFGDSTPDTSQGASRPRFKVPSRELTVWFCSVYILCGLALTSMCFNVVHEELVQRLKSHYILVDNKVEGGGSKENSIASFKMTPRLKGEEELLPS